MKPRLQNQRGMTLVEALVVMGMLTLSGLAMSTLLINMNRDVATLRMKLEIADLKRVITQIMSDPDRCTYQMQQLKGTKVDLKPDLDGFGKPIFPIARPYSMTKVQLGVAGSETILEVGKSLPGTVGGLELEVENVFVSNFNQSSPVEYTADLVANLKPKNLNTAPLTPLRVKLVLQVDSTKGLDQSEIVACLGTTGVTPTPSPSPTPTPTPTPTPPDLDPMRKMKASWGIEKFPNTVGCNFTMSGKPYAHILHLYAVDETAGTVAYGTNSLLFMYTKSGTFIKCMDAFMGGHCSYASVNCPGSLQLDGRLTEFVDTKGAHDKTPP